LSEEEKLRRLEERRVKKYNDTHKVIDGIVFKICSICSEWKPCNEDNFYKNKLNGIDGLCPYCKVCHKQKSWDHQKNNQERYKERLKYYLKNKEWRINYQKRNSKEWRESGKQLEYQRKNKDKIKEYNLKRQQNKTHEISKEEWENCKNYFNYRCAYCNLKIEEHYNTYKGKLKWTDFHKDHVIHDGENDLSNCIPACKSCNSTKSSRNIDEWYIPNNELFCKVFNDENLIKVHNWLEEDYKEYIKK